MQNSSKVTTTATLDYQWHDHCMNETPFNSWLESVTGIFKTDRNTYQEHNLRVAPNHSVQIADKAQHAADHSSIRSATANNKDAAAATSHHGVNADLQKIMAQHLGINVEVSNYHGSIACAGTHTRNLSASSSPSLSSSSASAAFTEITTPTLDYNHFGSPSFNEAISPIQSANMPDHLREEKQPAIASRENSQSDGYHEDKEVNNITREFVPSAILKGGRRLPTADIVRKAGEVGVTFNPKYKGELTNFNLRNAMCLDHENCSVRIHKIPPEASHCEIFALITHGKVFSFNYIRPVENLFTHAAADLVFLTREAAEKFLHGARFGHGLYIRGQRITVMWNRIKVLPAEGRYEKMSRVVRIKGPAEIFQ